MKTPTTRRTADELANAVEDEARSTQEPALTMKAVVQSRYGSPDEVLELRDIDRPTPKDDEVLVRLQASSVAKGDWLVINGLPYLVRLMGYGLRKPKNKIPGVDLSGRVAAVGNGVTRFQIGDEVFGWGAGAFAEYVVASQDSLVAKPARVTFEQAAAVPVSASTALQSLRDKGQVAAGQRVLITGGSGGVGTFAVQIAKSFGAEVTGVSSTGNLEMVKALGADHVIDYTRQDITASGQRYDLIIDIAGNRSLSELRRALTPRGTLVMVGGSGGRWLMGSHRQLWAMLVSPFVRQRLRPFLASLNRDDLVVLQQLIEAGKITPHVSAQYPLGEITEAVRHFETGHASGKVAITM